MPKEYLPDFIRGYFDGGGNTIYLKGNRDTLRIGNCIYGNDLELFLLRKREKFH
nr:MAG TPA: I-CREI, GROUP I MOBILE INTRON.0A [Caudoviricetes sp.]